MAETKRNPKERTLIILKPDALQRGLLGEMVHRFERKGIKIVGLKMMRLNDSILNRHYAAHKEKPFFEPTKKFMQLLPVVVIVLEGLEVARVARAMCGPTDGKNAPMGTIRGDFGMSISSNIVHSSEDAVAAKREIGIFFTPKEIFSYEKPDLQFFYAEDELG
jgi:nucleoside-diphosphate kinase